MTMVMARWIMIRMMALTPTTWMLMGEEKDCADESGNEDNHSEEEDKK